MVGLRAGRRNANHAPVVPRVLGILRHGDVAAAGEPLALLSHDLFLSSTLMEDLPQLLLTS